MLFSSPNVRSLRIAGAAGGLAVIVGVLVLIGWATGNRTLLQVQLAWTPMVPMTAFAFCLAGMSLLAITKAISRGWDGWRRTGLWLALAVAAIGGRRLVLYCLGWPTSADMLGLVPPEGPGQMAMMTALGFLLAGSALAVTARRAFHQAAQWLAAAVIFLGWMGITRYFYGGDTTGVFFKMAMHTALLFAVLGIGIFYARPDGGFVLIWDGDTTGSMLVRRLFPASLIMPVLVGWVCLQYMRAGLLGAETGLAVFAMSNVLIFAILVWHTASRLHHEDIRRREAERAILEGKRFSDTILEGLPGTFFMHDRTGMILQWNKNFERATGYGAEEIRRMHPLDFMPEGERHQIAGRIDEALTRGGATAEVGLRRKDGTETPYFFTGVLVTLDGRECVAVLGIDMTEHQRSEAALRESEARFRQVVENIQEVFWMRDVQQNRIIYVSPSYDRIWGRDHNELGSSIQGWVESLHPEDRDNVLRAAQDKQLSGTYDEIYRIVRPDGTVRWIHDQAYPIRDSEGKVYRIVGTAEDITERRKLEEQFRQAQKLEAIGTLAGGIAHDFNNILGAIMGYAELTKMCVKDNAPALGHLDAVLQGSRRAAALVRQILTFSRQQDHQRIPLQLSLAVEEPLKLLRATIPATIQIEETFSADLPTVLADPTQIHQVMMNLCTNAAYAMKDRPGRLGVKLEKITVDAHMAKMNTNLHAGPYVRLTVSDTGCGMSTETARRIFEPFFTTKAPGEGTGLGLSVVHGIMRNHDGAVTVYSEPGEGSVFHLYFPVYAFDVPREMGAPADAPKGNGERILFLDDEKPLALLGQALLESLGYVVIAGTQAEQMLALVKADPAGFDLVVTDLAMPGMTGTEFAVQVLKIRPDLPVILTTGYTANLTPERTRAMGIRELLLKPLTRESLGMAVGKVFGAISTS